MQSRSDEPGPKLSVCIPTYNRAALVSETIESVLTQQNDDVEVIVVDDASNDETASLAQEWVARGVRYYRNDTNLGMVGNWNRCIELARGNAVWILHDDDRMQQDALAYVISLFEHYDAGLVIGAHRLVGTAADEDRPDAIRVYGRGLDAIRQIARYDYSCVAVVFSREASGRAGKFDERFRYSADEEYWLRFAREFDLVRTNRVIVQRRIHERNYMMSTWREADFLEQYARLSEAVADALASTGANRSEVAAARARPSAAVLGHLVPTLLRIGEPRLARRYLLRISSTTPNRWRWFALLVASLLPERLLSSLLARHESRKGAALQLDDGQ